MTLLLITLGFLVVYVTIVVVRKRGWEKRKKSKFRKWLEYCYLSMKD